jgi:hypothetical protein
VELLSLFPTGGKALPGRGNMILPISPAQYRRICQNRRIFLPKTHAIWQKTYCDIAGQYKGGSQYPRMSHSECANIIEIFWQITFGDIAPPVYVFLIFDFETSSRVFGKEKILKILSEK